MGGATAPATDQPTLVELQSQIRRAELSVTELVGSCLSRLRRDAETLGAVPTIAAERALAEAQIADHRRRDARGALAGIPLLVDDLLPTRGTRTTFGSKLFEHHTPRTDAPIVARLRAAGAIVVGKTNTAELGYGHESTNQLFGPTRNPYDASRSAGGSCGGAAVAVRLGLAPLAVGEDVGGDVRAPAGFCNVVGVRFTHGALPNGASASAWQTLGAPGIFTRTVSDAALVWRALTQVVRRHPLSTDLAHATHDPDLERDWSEVPIAYSPGLGRYQPRTAVATAFSQALESASGLGISLREVTPDSSGLDEIYRMLEGWSLALTYGPRLKESRTRLRPALRDELEQALKLNGLILGRVQEARLRLWREIDQIFDDHALLLLPTTFALTGLLAPQQAQELPTPGAQADPNGLAACWPSSVLGLPSLSVPGGFTRDGLPCGLQIVGPRHADDLLLQLAYAYEQATGHGARVPALSRELDDRTAPYALPPE